MLLSACPAPMRRACQQPAARWFNRFVRCDMFCRETNCRLSGLLHSGGHKIGQRFAILVALGVRFIVMPVCMRRRTRQRTIKTWRFGHVPIVMAGVSPLALNRASD